MPPDLPCQRPFPANPAGLGTDRLGGRHCPHENPPRTPLAAGRQLSFSSLQPVRLSLPVSVCNLTLNLTA